MLYDGAMRFMEAGKHAIQTGDLEAQNVQLQKAQRIVTELMACLDTEQGGDIAKNLLALYMFVLNQLVEANIKDDAKAVEVCIGIFSELRESWFKLEQSSRGSNGEPVAA